MPTIIDEVRAEVVTEPPAHPETPAAPQPAETDARRLRELMDRASVRAARLEAD